MSATRHPPVELRCCAIRLEPEALSRYARSLGLAGPGEASAALARAVARSAGIRAVVLKPGPRPLLAVWGPHGDGNAERLGARVRDLGLACARLRYVSYPQIHADCEALASRLIDVFGRREPLRFRYAAVPRGGFVVLGLLATAMGLKPGLLREPHPADVPLVVVDDCALTGARFGAFIDRCASHRVVFTPFYSHPRLRAAMLDQEPRLTACLSAHDLTEPADAGITEDQRTRWLAAMNGKRYWIGATEPLCFPWNEPPRLIPDPVREQLLTGWRLVPSELCLKNRPAPVAVAVQEQPAGRGPLAPAPGVVFGRLGELVVMADLESGRSFALDGAGADAWHAIVRLGNVTDAVAALVESYATPEEDLRRDVQELTEELLVRGLLEQRPDRL